MTISKPRLKEIKAISDEDIDYSDIPELGEDFSGRPKSGCRRRNPKRS
jgi:hypothetical protein